MAERKSVLLIDDDDYIIRAYRRIMSGFAVDITTELTGESALELLRTGRKFDLIMLDVHLSFLRGLQGDELYRMLRAQGIETPIILMSVDPHILGMVHLPSAYLMPKGELDLIRTCMKRLIGQGAPFLPEAIRKEAG